jgi:hypothetical protein
MKNFLLLLFFLIPSAFSMAAQPDTSGVHKVPYPVSYKSGTILVSTENEGKLYFDDKFVGKIEKFNLIKIRGIRPDTHSICLKTTSDSVRKEINVRKERIYTCKIDKDSICIKGRRATDPLIGTRVSTTLFEYVPKIRGFYNVTQIGIVSAGIKFGGLYPLNSISAICGYRFTHWFGLGLGAGFTLMYSGGIPFQYTMIGDFSNIHATYNYKGLVGFFPVFLDLRSDLTFKKIALVTYLNIGVILVYHQNIAQVKYGGTSDPGSANIVIPPGSGIYLASGVGVRIFISRNIAIVPAIEVSYKQLQYYAYQAAGYLSDKATVNLPTAGLVMGVSF